jgi:hypothetical protein
MIAHKGHRILRWSRTQDLNDLAALTDLFALLATFLLGLFFDPENGGDMFLRNVGFNWLHGVMSQKIRRLDII